MKKNKLHITSTGFNTPKDYFESFDEKLIDNILEPSKLNVVKETGYKAPEHYFENFDNTVLKTISKEATPVIGLNKRKINYYITGIAASILLLIGIFSMFTDNNELSTEMVTYYLQDSDLNSYELAELLSEANLLEDNFSIFETTYEEEPLENYLLESNTDIDLLLDAIQ